MTSKKKNETFPLTREQAVIIGPLLANLAAAQKEWRKAITLLGVDPQRIARAEIGDPENPHLVLKDKGEVEQ